MQEFVYVVMTNAAKGREDAYNDWYDHIHLQDVVEVPGIVSARRYTLGDIQRRALPRDQARYMALYDIRTPDLPQTLAVLAERSGTRQMPTSDALMRHSAVIYRAIGPLVRQR